MSRPATRLVNFTAARMVPFSVLSLLVSVVVFYGLHNGGVHGVKPSQFKDKSRSKTYPSSPLSSIHDTSPFEISKFESDGVPTSAQNDNMVLSKNDDMVISENDEVLMARNSGDMLTAKKKSPENHSVLMELARTKEKKLEMKASTSERGCCNGDTSSVADKGCCNGEKSFERDCCIGDRTTSVSVGIGGTHKKDDADTVYHHVCEALNGTHGVFEALGVSYNQQTGAQPSTSTFVSLDYANVVRKDLDNACDLYRHDPLPTLSQLAIPGFKRFNATSGFLLVTTLNSVFDTFFNITGNMKLRNAAFQGVTKACDDPSSDRFNNNVCELRGKCAKKFNEKKNRLQSKYEKVLSDAASKYRKDFKKVIGYPWISSQAKHRLYDALKRELTKVKGLTMPKMSGFGRGQVVDEIASGEGCRTLPSGTEINDFEDYLHKLQNITEDVAKHVRGEFYKSGVPAKAKAILKRYTEARNEAQEMYSNETNNDPILAEYALRLFALAAPSQNPADESQKNPFASDEDASKEDEDDERCTNLLKKQAAIEYLGVVPPINIDLTKWYDDIFLDQVKKGQKHEVEIFDWYVTWTCIGMGVSLSPFIISAWCLRETKIDEDLMFGYRTSLGCHVAGLIVDFVYGFLNIIMTSGYPIPFKNWWNRFHVASLERKKKAYKDCVVVGAVCHNVFALIVVVVVIFPLWLGNCNYEKTNPLWFLCGWRYGLISLYLIGECLIGLCIRTIIPVIYTWWNHENSNAGWLRGLWTDSLLAPLYQIKRCIGSLFNSGGAKGQGDDGNKGESGFIQEDASSSYHIV